MVSIEKHSLDPLAAGVAVDFTQALQGSHRLVDVVDQETRLPVFDHFTARAEVHGDHGHAGGIGFRQDQSESLRDGVQVQQRPGLREQRVLARHVHRPDVADRLIEVGLHLLAEVGLILDNARDEQRQPAQASNLDRQMDALVRVNPAEEDQVIAAAFLKRVQREVDSVIDRSQIVQPRRAIGVADGDEVSVAILLDRRA